MALLNSPQRSTSKSLNLINFKKTLTLLRVLSLSPTSRHLVIENPRPYNVVNLFSVRVGCDECAALYTELVGAAYSYIQHEEHLKVPTFFGAIYFSGN